MSFRINAIFIRHQQELTQAEILGKLNYKTKQLPKVQVDFFETNNRWNKLFMGRKGDCSIVCNGKLINRAFEEADFAAAFPNSEICAIIWDEAVDTFGFTLFINGRSVRKILVSNGEFEYDNGFPVTEEEKIKDNELLDADEMVEILNTDGKEALQNILKTERTIHSTNRIVARFLGADLVSVEEEILLEEYG